MKIRIAAISFVLPFAFLVQGHCQQLLTGDEGIEFNRMQHTFSAALSLINRTDLGRPDRLATTREQKEKFIEFDERREALTATLSDVLKGSEEERRANCLELIKKFKLMETELKEEILLPFQVERLEKATFLRQVRNFRGNYSRVIDISYYRRFFHISDQQKQQLETLNMEKEKEIQKILKERKERIAEVETRSRKELRRLFTKEQEKVMEDLSGREFGASAKQNNVNPK